MLCSVSPSLLILIMCAFALDCGQAHASSSQVVSRRLQQDMSTYPILDGQSAKAFCAKPDFKSTVRCDWASAAEESATLQKQCPLCGTIFRGPPKSLPAEQEGRPTYNQYITKIISLACKGPVVVRTVFKMLQEPPTKPQPGWAGTNCTNSGLVLLEDTPASEGGAASPIVRCELQLPTTSSDGGSSSEVDRALKAKEVKCWQCGRCSKGQGCPSNIGTWYSDSFTTTAQGCDIDPKVGYNAHRVGININPDTKILLAKYEVCNNPGCFDPAYEQAKIKAARPCTNGKCAQA